MLALMMGQEVEYWSQICKIMSKIQSLRDLIYFSEAVSRRSVDGYC